MEREELAQLVDRARKELREWADSGEEDVSVALVELLAIVGDLLSEAQDLLADEAYLGGKRSRAGGIRLEVDGERWHRRPDLASSGPDDRHFVVITQEDGRAAIRFGDGEHGRRPPKGSDIRMRYRSGQGATGNRFTAVRLQKGRVLLDADWNEPTTTDLAGQPRPHGGVMDEG